MNSWLGLWNSAKSLVCDHRYCYRSLNCTKCNKRYSESGEPEYSRHIVMDGKLVPAKLVNDVLVPE